MTQAELPLQQDFPAQPPRPKGRKLLLGIGAVAVILGGGVAAYVSQRTVVPGPEQALSLVPENAIAVLSLTDDRSQWETARRLGTPSLQKGLGQWLAIGRDRITNLGYGDWQQVQTQLAGEPAIALVPATVANPSTNPALKPQSDLLLVAPLKNPGAIQQKIRQLKPPQGFENQVSDYRGVEVWQIQADLAQRHHVAILGSYALVAANGATLERAIDSYFDRKSLLQLEDYRIAQQRQQPANSDSERDPFATLYLNAPAATQATTAAGRLLPLPSDIQGLMAQIDLVDNGFSIESLTWQLPRNSGLSLLNPSDGKRVDLTTALGDRFPASTSLLLTGRSLKDAWSSYSQNPNASPLLNANALREQIKAVTSMDLDQDWLTWMDGSYAVGLLPIPSKANSRFEAGLTVMVQTGNRRLAERSLQKLDSLMVNKYRLRLNTGTLAGQPVVNWLNQAGEPVVTHGWLEGNVAFLIVGAPGASLLLPQPQATLAGSPLYREGMPRSQDATPATGQLFMDLDRVSKTNLPSLLPLPVGLQPFVDALKSAGAERRIEDERWTRYDLNFQFLRSFDTLLPEAKPTAPSSTSSSTSSSTPSATPTPNSSPTPSPTPSSTPSTAPSAEPKASDKSELIGPIQPQTSTEAKPELKPELKPEPKPEMLGPVLPQNPRDRQVMGPLLPPLTRPPGVIALSQHQMLLHLNPSKL